VPGLKLHFFICTSGLKLHFFNCTSGLKLQFQLQATDRFSSIGAELSPLGLPDLPGGGAGSALYSDEYLERFVRSQTLTGHHPTSTCKMGAASDNTAVVDHELR